MKNSLSLFIALLLLVSFPNNSIAQTVEATALSYEVHKIYPYISISKEKLQEVQSIRDFKNVTNGLNLEYKSEWVKTYNSVEISAIQGGQLKKATSNDDMLTTAQKELINGADTGTAISVRIDYLPENNLKHNEPKELYFSFSIDPKMEAVFPGGTAALYSYLETNAIDNIPVGSFQAYDLTNVKFIIDEEGKVTNVHVFGAEYQSDRNEEIENLLLNTISNMPCWTPAEYADGTKMKQEYVLTVGNMENCMVNLMNIRRDE